MLFRGLGTRRKRFLARMALPVFLAPGGPFRHPPARTANAGTHPC
jgi:hypothetical protein